MHEEEEGAFETFPKKVLWCFVVKRIQLVVL